MKESKEIELELKSESMNEMLSHPPSWIVRSGNGLFLIVLALVVGLSWLIEYPDEISGEVTVSTSRSPIELNNQLYVQLKSLSVKDGQWVTKDQLLARFDNQVKTGDVEKANRYLDEIGNLELHTPVVFPILDEHLQLGALQESWAMLEKHITEWNNALKSDLANEQMGTVRREITYREQLKAIASHKIKLSESEYELIAEELRGSERLAQQSAISKQTLNQEKRTQTQAMQTVQSQKEQYVENLIRLNTLREELLKLGYEKREKEQERSSAIELAIATLRNRIDEWRKSAVWVAPCSGKVLFNKHLQIHQFYKANQASIVIVPDGNTFVATAIIGTTGAGKVKAGQQAFIELTDYPKNEYGMIEGIVSHITQIDKEGKYEVRIRLPKQLKTTYKKRIPLKAQLKGTVKIVTKKKRLLERLFEKLTDLAK